MKYYRVIETHWGFDVEVKRWWGWKSLWNGLSIGGARVFMKQHGIPESLTVN